MRAQKRGLVVFTGLAALPSAVLAHHSFFGRFDTLSLVEIEGEVTEVLWRNPHAYFGVRSEGVRMSNRAMRSRAWPWMRSHRLMPPRHSPGAPISFSLPALCVAITSDPELMRRVMAGSRPPAP